MSDQKKTPVRVALTVSLAEMQVLLDAATNFDGGKSVYDNKTRLLVCDNIMMRMDDVDIPVIKDTDASSGEQDLRAIDSEDRRDVAA